MLKLAPTKEVADNSFPAAFRRLCVETTYGRQSAIGICPAAFRRLCVETSMPETILSTALFPAAFRRLCVETAVSLGCGYMVIASRLQAAVC